MDFTSDETTGELVTLARDIAAKISTPNASPNWKPRAPRSTRRSGTNSAPPV